MNILLLAPHFYGYHSVIKAEIERQGNICDSYLYPNSFLYKFFSFVFRDPSFIKPYLIWHFHHYLKKINKNYDYILVIKGSVLPSKCIMDFLRSNPQSKTVLYIWDDINLDQGELDVMHLFDRVLSYNPQDCKKYNLVFRPMFYDQSLCLNVSEKPIDLFYIASYRHNRMTFIKKVMDDVGKRQVKSLIVLRCSIFYYLSRISNIKYLKYLKIKPIPYYDMMKYLSKSKCSIELCRPNQESLSTRSFEALFTKTKVVTTNQSIKGYDFYNENNILVVDEKSPHIDLEWINRPYQDVPNEILSNYSLKKFVKDLLS